MKKTIKRFLKKCLYKLPSSYCLMFHHIDDGHLLQKSGCILSYNSFVDILDSGLSFISADEYVTFSRRTFGRCMITFDDGLKDVYHVAYPELKKRQIPFTLFIIVDFLDTEGYITTQELITMSKDPLVTIASHGMTHDILEGMEREHQKYELLESKTNLEQLIKKEVKYFAFSHGRYDETTIEILKQGAEYTYAFGVAGYPTNLITRGWKYHLPRINCENDKIRFEIVSRMGKKVIQLE